MYIYRSINTEGNIDYRVYENRTDRIASVGTATIGPPLHVVVSRK